MLTDGLLDREISAGAIPMAAEDRFKQGLYRFHQVTSPLSKYEGNVASQCGEDGIIARINELLCPEHKFCVEFGAWDGKLHSNCYNLIANQNWAAMMIEADGEKFKELERTYGGNTGVTSVHRFVDFEGANTLDNILAEFGAPRNFGLLSIDIDGNDFYVFESLTNYSPEVVVIEFNPTVPNDVVFVQEKTFEVNHGCSLLALVFLGREKGYELAVCTSTNAIFVKKEKLATIGIKDNFIFRMYAPMQDGRIFQGYDGSIHVVGMNRLIWKDNMPVSSEDFQVLPKAYRHWAHAQRR
jgi:hypothetical protein